MPIASPFSLAFSLLHFILCLYDQNSAPQNTSIEHFRYCDVLLQHSRLASHCLTQGLLILIFSSSPLPWIHPLFHYLFPYFYITFSPPLHHLLLSETTSLVHFDLPEHQFTFVLENLAQNTHSFSWVFGFTSSLVCHQIQSMWRLQLVHIIHGFVIRRLDLSQITSLSWRTPLQNIPDVTGGHTSEGLLEPSERHFGCLWRVPLNLWSVQWVHMASTCLRASLVTLVTSEGHPRCSPLLQCCVLRLDIHEDSGTDTGDQLVQVIMFVHIPNWQSRHLNH